jgi:hypothetical protein
MCVPVAFAVGTAHAAVTRLRPALRAQEVGWRYSYGFYPPEPDGGGGERRWAQRRAVAVVPAPSRRIIVTISVNHLDIAEHPVHAKVWIDGQLAMDEHLASTQPVAKSVDLKPGNKHALIETWVSRVLNARDSGVPDGREPGLLVSWRFADASNGPTNQ